MATYCFDLDGTICTQEKPDSYQIAKPNKSIIKKINRLYDSGNIIYIYTARHMLNCEMTKNWLKSNNVKYHHIFFNKPAADFFIDDRGVSIKDFMKK